MPMQNLTSELNLLLAISNYTRLLLVLSMFGAVFLLLLLAILVCLVGALVVESVAGAYQNNPAKCKKRLVVCTLLLAALASCLLGKAWQMRKTQALSAATVASFAQEANLYAQLNPATWQTFTEAQRLALLQAAANAEAELLGISRSVTLVAKEIEAGTNTIVTGYLYSGSGTIVINSAILEASADFSSYDCLETVLHEVYHVYQQELIALYVTLDSDAQSLLMFETVRCYIDEFSGGYLDHTTEEGFAAYASQQLEVDASSYAAAQTALYLQSMYDIWDITPAE